MTLHLEATYGPPALYSEHTPDDVAVYTQEDLFYTGTILYVAMHGLRLNRVAIAPLYIVLPTYDASFPEEISPADIVIEDTFFGKMP